MIRRGGAAMLGCGACSKGGLGRSLFDEREAEFISPPAGWFLFMDDGILPGHVTMSVYCSEACGRKAQPWATEWFRKEMCCWECGMETLAPALGAPAAERALEASVLFVLVPGWLAFSADGGDLLPGRAVLLTYCSEACVRKANEAAVEE